MMVPASLSESNRLYRGKLNTLTAAIKTLLASSMVLSPAYAELPVPSQSVTLSATPVEIASQGSALASVAGQAMTIKQTTDKAGIDWQSFNIGSDNSVRFDQPAATSVALNNIHQADASQILGSLTANGQVYLVNQNGFVFGKNSEVNVNSLVATTLGISDTTLKNGLTQAFNDNGGAALQGSGETYLKDSSGQYVLDELGEKIKIQIYLEPGAKIATNATGGRVIIAAPVITNAGTITTPDGQTILAAAKDKVYLQEAGTDSDIRGLLVEVGKGGEVNNLGNVIAERGNVSVMGFAVNQQGIASATTSVNLNGSVRLLAREGIQDPSATGGQLFPQATVRTVAEDDGLGTVAQVHLAPGSMTSVDLESDKSETAIDAQTQSRSQIELSGHDVIFAQGSKVLAHSGDITAQAIDDPTDASVKGNARIFMASGSVIDASGVKDVAVPIDRNIVSVELRKFELRDSPLQRDGVLYGQTVHVDLRDADLTYDSDGTLTSASIPVADIKGAVDRIARNIDERSTSGGTVSFASTGDVVTQTGSLIDFSGGSVAYQDGYVGTTQLVHNGELVDISQAEPEQVYDAIYGQIRVNHAQWGVSETWAIPGLAGKHFEAGYTDGKAGGQLTINSYEALLNGNLDGSTVAGSWQRQPEQQADGSLLTLNLSNNSLLSVQDITLTQATQNADINFTDLIARADDAANQAIPLLLSAELLQRSGVSRLHLTSNGVLRLVEQTHLQLPEHGELIAAATGFDLQGELTAPSGAVTLKPVTVADTLLPNSISLGESARIDFSGTWVNDVLDSQNQTALATIANAGGQVQLITEQRDLVLNPGSRIDVSGGAWLNNHAQVTAGAGGSIELSAANHDSGGQAANLVLQGELLGYGIKQGGELSLSSSAVIIGTDNGQSVNTAPEIKPLTLSQDFFNQGGFADYNITSTVLGLTVADGTQLTPKQQNLLLTGNLAEQATGSALTAFSTVTELPDDDRQPVSLSLNFQELTGQDQSQVLSIGKNALIQTDPGATVSLASDTSIWLDGSIQAPAGTINLTINTPSGGDKGFATNQGIWLGTQSALIAKGEFQPDNNPYGLVTGDVLAGGNVNITAKRGYIVSQAGSVINVSGTSARLDFTESDGVVSRKIASAGGAITLSAGEGIIADGGFYGHAGGNGVEGGSLSVTLNRNFRNKPTLPVAGGLFPDDVNSNLPREIVVNAEPGLVGAGLNHNKALDAEAYSGRALLNANKINQGGFASLQLTTDVLGAKGSYAGAIRFNDPVALTADKQIILDTPTLKTDGDNAITLNTAYAKIGSSTSRMDTETDNGQFSTTLAPNAKTGTGEFTVNAQGIELVGGLSFDGFDHVQLNSAGDVRATGIRTRSDTKDYLGEFKLAGDLTINASQLYTPTLTDYKVGLTGDDTTLTVQSNLQAAAPVYSAGSRLTLKAANIVQQGVIKAPFGELTLTASKQLTLAAGSLTSVSGDGLTVLFGQGSGGDNWLYPLDSTGGSNRVVETPPEKQVHLTGDSITFTEGAKLDVSGGGDLYAYEFISGNGGSSDVLNPTASGYTEKYAVLQGLANALSPYNPVEWETSGLSVGDSVYLSAGSALAAGWYTLLPAHYALLPGAYLVTPKAGYQDIPEHTVLSDIAGRTVVAGRFGTAATGDGDARWHGFTVESGSVARTEAEYKDYTANQFFSAKALTSGTEQALLPQDAGRLALNAQTGLTLAGGLSAQAAQGGVGGQVDISAQRLAIIATDVASNQEEGVVALSAQDLNRLNAPSLLLGGTRTKTTNGQKITVTGQTITLANNAQLSGSELLLAAKDEIHLQSGVKLSSDGRTSQAGVAYSLVNQGQSNGDSVFVSVSASGLSDASRSQTITGKTGNLIVDSGATIASANSIRLDATKDAQFNGALDLSNGALALSAGQVSLGAAPADTSGLVLTDTALNLSELMLSSRSAINLYGDMAIHADTVHIDAAQINGFNNDGLAATISADTLVLANSSAKKHSNGLGSGVLNLNAQTIALASGDYAITGFNQVNLNAESALIGLGQTVNDDGLSQLSQAGQLTIAANTTLTAGHITGENGATTSIQADGYALNLAAVSTADTRQGLGVSWSMRAEQIQGNARFDLPAGILKLTANTGDIKLDNGFTADVSGRVLAFAEQSQAAAAGRIALTATQGNIVLADGAHLNLAGAVNGAESLSADGRLDVLAPNGVFTWQGSIDAGTAQGSEQLGDFYLTANRITDNDFSALNSALSTAGFNNTINLQLNAGDLTITESDTLRAQHIALNTTGSLQVLGQIDASGDKGGSVELKADGIRLGQQAKILALATGENEDGGRVSLDVVHQHDTGTGTLDLSETGSVIDVAGGVNGLGGHVHLRVGREDSLNQLAVTEINTRFKGVTENLVNLEAVKVYDGQSVIKAGAIAAWQKDTADFMSSSAVNAFQAKYDAIELAPGLDIRSSGDLTLTDAWDLLAWRYQEANGTKTIPGYLSLNAQWQLNINASLTDAFATAYLPGQSSIKFQDVLQPGRSWSYDLSAGGNINLAATYSAINPYGTGGKAISQVMVRTGTGDIALHAGGDINYLADVGNERTAAAVYTMGTTALYTRSQLLSGAVPGVAARLTGETDSDYLNRLNPEQLNAALRYGYFNETLLGLQFMVAEYPSQGGSIQLHAGGDIKGINTGQSISDWLVRSGAITENNRPTAWGINISGERSSTINGIATKGNRYFNQNLGALGGGDVTVSAGGDITELSVMLPSTGKAFGTVSSLSNQWTASGTVINGGGDLSVTAGNNLLGGEYYVALGKAELTAGGSLTSKGSTYTEVGSGNNSTNALAPIVELGDAVVQLTARQDLELASVFNPTLLKQTNTQPLAAGGDSRFFTYTDQSRVNLTAVAGNVVLENDVDAVREARNIDISSSSGFEYAVYPGALSATALSGDIRINHSMTLFPSPQGQLSLYAYHSINTDNDAAQIININMSDVEPSWLPSVTAPAQQLEGSLSDGLIRARERLDPSTPDATLIHAAIPLHQNDTKQPTIIASTGDINFSSASEVAFYLPSASTFQAGRDINNLSVYGQNLSVADTTTIKAGRDIRYDALLDSDGHVQANDRQIELGGPGNLNIQAGRDVNLGGSAGVNTIGNTKNTVLPSSGAGVDVLVGLNNGSAALNSFINRYFTLTSRYLSDLKIVDDAGNDVTATLTAEQKLAYFKQLPAQRQQPFVLAALYNELQQSAKAAALASDADKTELYQQGFDAINTLFPDKAIAQKTAPAFSAFTTSLWLGDLSMVFSQIKTLAGGGINIAAPGGSVNVGLAGSLAGIEKSADQLGIVAQQQGDINAVSNGDFNVNQSRVFTMGGGDIAIWSSAGNIDAGKGAKSAISAPAPITSIDANGNVLTIFPPIVSGSGIQTITPQDGSGKQGNVYLAAPAGIVDAGEAGISGGQIVIAATAVVGASNISASGGSIGVPSVAVVPVAPSAAVGAAASAGKTASQTNDELNQNQLDSESNNKLSVLSVDVLGYGDCNGKERDKKCGG